MNIFYISKRTLKKFFLIIVIMFLLLLAYKFYMLTSLPSFRYKYNFFEGKTIVVDAGHGGVDGGVVHSSGLMEKDINLDIAKKLTELLKESGANCIITREKDIELSHLSDINDTRHRKDLNGRVNIINNSKADFFISIHVNSFPQDQRVKGPIVFYYNQSEVSKELAQCIQQNLNIEYDKHYREKLSAPKEIKGEDYYILRYANSPGVIVETGFMSNNDDYKLLKSDRFRYIIAYQIYIAIGEFLEL